MSKFNVLPIAILVLALTLACSRPSAPVRLGIAAQQSPSQMLVYLARDLGAFEAEHVRVEVEEFPGSAKALEALLGGSLDAVSGYHDQTLNLPEGSPPVRSFVAMTNGQLVALVVSPAAKNKIATLDDLRGKTIGVTTLGSATHLLLNFVMGPREFHPVAIGTAGRSLAAMERGAVDAGVVSDFTVRHLEKRFGQLTILADTRTPEKAARVHGVAMYPGASIFAKRDWIASHPGEAGAIARAIARARTWVLSHSPDEVAARMPASHKGQDPSLYRDVIGSTMAMLTPDGRFTEDGAEAARRLNGSKKNAKESYTNEFVEGR